MLFKEAKELFAIRFKDFDVTTPEGKSKSEKYVNLALKDLYRAHLWEYRKRIGQIVLIPNYTTGTVAITTFDGTNEGVSRTATFSGATLTQSMVGRYLRLNGKSNWYKILRIDVNTAYLETPVVDAQPSSGAYEIWKRFYYLPSEVDVVESFKNWDFYGNMEFNSDSKLTDKVHDVSLSGNPYSFSAYGVDPYDDIQYSDGSISIAKDSNIVTGIGTAWLSNNVKSGDILEFNGNVQFTVKRVETDTRLIAWQYATDEIAAAPYKIKKDNPIGFQFYYTANDFKILEFSYYRRGHFLYNENKEDIYLPDRFIPALMDRAQAMYLKDKNDAAWTNVQNLYSLELEGLKQQKQIVNAPFRQFQPSLGGMPGRS